MTKKEKDYTNQQLSIIENKINEDMLSKYATLLSMSSMSKEVKDFLIRAVDMKKKELNPISPMVISSEF